MKTVLRDLILGDWGPTMEAIARSLALAIAIPAAIVLVFAQWLAFTWRRPLAGVLAVVPVRKPDPINAISVAALSRSVLCQIGANEDMDQALADVAAAGAAIGLGLKIAPSSPQSDESSPQSDESSPRSESVAPRCPYLTTSDLIKAGASISETKDGPMSLRMDFGMARSTSPVAPLPPALTPAPRKQRRGSKRLSSPA
jgi:hypothetical protein